MTDKLPILDWTHLHAATGEDTALEREILDMFLAQATSYLEDLASSDNDNEYQALAHKLKGAARGIGAVRLARCVEQAEAAGLTGRERFLESVRGECDRLRRTIVQRLSENLP